MSGQISAESPQRPNVERALPIAGWAPPMERFTKILKMLAASAALSGVFGTAAQAGIITVTNASFETLPAGGLPYASAGSHYSIDTGIPGWTTSGTGEYGEWQTNGNFLSSIPNGSTVAYSNGGTISQTVGVTAQAGLTYTLMVAQGYRYDGPDLGTIALDIGSTVIDATPATIPVQYSGTWVTYTATFTVPAADAGLPITIELSTPAGGQADWDNVSLTDAVPQSVSEPGTLVLLGGALAGFALTRRRRHLEQWLRT